MRHPDYDPTPADCAYDRREALGQDDSYDPDIDWDFSPALDPPLTPDSELEVF